MLHPHKAFEVPSYRDFLERQMPAFRIFDNLPAQPGLVRLRPHRFFVEGERIVYVDGSRPLYQDDHHLNLTGAGRLISLFEEVLSGTASDDPVE
jgi:hypothetical protein